MPETGLMTTTDIERARRARSKLTIYTQHKLDDIRSHGLIFAATCAGNSDQLLVNHRIGRLGLLDASAAIHFAYLPTDQRERCAHKARVFTSSSAP